MLESEIRKLVSENGNLINLNYEYESDMPIGYYSPVTSYEGNIWHNIFIQANLPQDERQKVLIHEMFHIYLRELKYDYEEVIGQHNRFSESESISSQLANLFDHWILISAVGVDSNSIFFNQLNDSKNVIVNIESQDVEMQITNALALLDYSICLNVKIEISLIKNEGLRLLFSQIYNLKEILVFTNSIEYLNMDFRNQYFEKIRLFLAELNNIIHHN